MKHHGVAIAFILAIATGFVSAVAVESVPAVQAISAKADRIGKADRMPVPERPAYRSIQNPVAWPAPAFRDC